MSATIRQEFPFTQIPDWVIAAPISHAEFRVYAAICKHSNKNRTAYPGVRTISRDAHCSTSTVIAAVAVLEGIGAIMVSRDPKTRKTNRYLLPLQPFRGGVAISDTPVAVSDTEGVAVSATQLQPSSNNKHSLTERPTDPLWETVSALVGKPTAGMESLQGRLVKMIREQNHTKDEIHRRAELLVKMWGPERLTLASLEKHWNRLGVKLESPKEPTAAGRAEPVDPDMCTHTWAELEGEWMCVMCHAVREPA